VCLYCTGLNDNNDNPTTNNNNSNIQSDSPSMLDSFFFHFNDCKTTLTNFEYDRRTYIKKFKNFGLLNNLQLNGVSNKKNQIISQEFDKTRSLKLIRIVLKIKRITPYTRCWAGVMYYSVFGMSHSHIIIAETSV